MEYLMSYGWAILVVMVVGVAMWQLGIFNMHSVPTTASGFQAIQPIVATCAKDTDIWVPGQQDRGFTCQFFNNAGTDINLKGLWVTVEGKSCYGFAFDTNPKYIAGSSRILWYNCNNENLDCHFSTCMNCVAGRIPIQKDGQFSVKSYSRPSGQIGPCWTMEEGRNYEVTVDIIYDVTLGGVTSEKQSSGIIHLAY
jgi:hypothetical protein